MIISASLIYNQIPVFMLDTTHHKSLYSEANYRWSRSVESTDYFDEAERYKFRFLLLTALAALLCVALVTGLLRLYKVAGSPPNIIGISHGLMFGGDLKPLGSVEDADLDVQFSDTLEVLFSRTEHGLTSVIYEFCAPEVISAVERDYKDSNQKYPAGFVQTFSITGSKRGLNSPGVRHMRYSGVLASRSLLKAQVSVIYCEATFVITSSTQRNISGWKLVHLDSISRSEYFKDEHTRAVIKALNADDK